MHIAKLNLKQQSGYEIRPDMKALLEIEYLNGIFGEADWTIFFIYFIVHTQSNQSPCLSLFILLEYGYEKLGRNTVGENSKYVGGEQSNPGQEDILDA